MKITKKQLQEMARKEIKRQLKEQASVSDPVNDLIIDVVENIQGRVEDLIYGDYGEEKNPDNRKFKHELDEIVSNAILKAEQIGRDAERYEVDEDDPSMAMPRTDYA